jgi:very-short-patch-repair endonuclease
LEKDKLKVDNAINSGYQVLTIWEYDLINNTEETFKKIINYATS